MIFLFKCILQPWCLQRTKLQIHLLEVKEVNFKVEKTGKKLRKIFWIWELQTAETPNWKPSTQIPEWLIHYAHKKTAGNWVKTNEQQQQKKTQQNKTKTQQNRKRLERISIEISKLFHCFPFSSIFLFNWIYSPAICNLIRRKLKLK